MEMAVSPAVRVTYRYSLGEAVFMHFRKGTLYHVDRTLTSWKLTISAFKLLFLSFAINCSNHNCRVVTIFPH